MLSNVVRDTADPRVLVVGLGLLLGAVAAEPRQARGQALARGTMPGHKGQTGFVAYSPDGKLLASGGEDRILRIRETMRTGRKPLEVTTGSALRCGAFTPDGKVLVVGGEDGTCSVVDPATGKTVATIKAHTGAVGAIAFGSLRTLMATGGNDGKVVLWDGVTWKTGRGEFPPQGKPVLSLAFAPDGNSLAIGTGYPAGGAGTLSLVDPIKVAPLKHFDEVESAVWSVAFSPDGSLLAMASQGADGESMSIWDPPSGTRLRIYARDQKVRTVCFAPDGLTLVAGLANGTFVVFDSGAQFRRATLGGYKGQVFGVAVSPDGRTIASVSRDGMLKLRDAPTPPLILEHTFVAHTAFVAFTTFSPDGKLLVTGSADRTARLWDADSGALKGVLVGHKAELKCGTFAAGGRELVTGSGDATIKVWDLAKNAERLTIKAHSMAVTAVAMAPDGQRLASAGADKMVRLWDLATGKLLRTFAELPDRPNDLAFAPVGKTLAVGVGVAAGETAGLVKLWNFETGQEKATLTGFPAAVWKVAYSPDGQTLAAAGNDGTIKRWSAAGLDEQPPMSRVDPLWGLAFTPDGKTLIAGYGAGTLTFWNLDTGTNRVTMKVHGGPIRAISVTADGQSLATGSIDKTAKLWRFPEP